MLNSVAFTAKIKGGIIEIPEEYKRQVEEDNEFQVIVIKKAKKTNTS